MKHFLGSHRASAHSCVKGQGTFRRRLHRSTRMMVLPFLLATVHGAIARSQELLLPLRADPTQPQQETMGVHVPMASGVPSLSKAFSSGIIESRTNREPTGLTTVRAQPIPATNMPFSESRATNVWRGAIIGGLVAGGATAIYLSTSKNEVVMSPFAFVPIVAGGALIGALIGAAVGR